MAGSGTDGRWSRRLLVPLVTVTLPLAVLGWQFWLAAPSLVTPVPSPRVNSSNALAVEPAPAPDLEVLAAEGLLPQVAPAGVSREPIAADPPRIEPQPTPVPVEVPRDVWGGESAFNFVVAGVDRRDDEIPRTDTIMVGSVDLFHRRLSLLSIPRDLLVEIPGYGLDRINAAFVYGEQFGEPGGGMGMLRRTIEGNFAIPIQHFGTIDFGCFRTAVDAIGGVTVEVPRTLVDDQYPTDDFGYRTVRFEAGLQWLDGERALQYARTRHVDNDLQRIRRQQQIVASIRHELLQFRSLPLLPTIVSGCRNMRSDLGLREYFGLTNALRQLGDTEVVMRSIDEGMFTEGYTQSGAAVLVPRWEPIRVLVRDTFRADAAANPAPTTPESDARAEARAASRDRTAPQTRGLASGDASRERGD